jgi:uroporphyrinogen-III synthase
MAATSLAGYVVGVTADRRADEQIELLRRRGATTLHGPSIKTLPLDAAQELRSVTEVLLSHPPDYVIANTGIGMRGWFAAADGWGLGDDLTDALSTSRIFARGPKAAAVVHAAGLEVASRAPSERLGEVVKLLLDEPLKGTRIAYQEHGDEVASALEPLIEAGATVIRVPVYRWIIPADVAPALRLIDAIAGKRLHAVTFTSAPAVRNLFGLAAQHGLDTTLSNAFNDSVVAACIGPVCAGQALDEGIERPLVPVRARLGLMVRALGDHLAEQAQPVDLDGVPVRLQGTALIIGAQIIELTDREAAVISMLMTRSRAVVSKTQLLRDVWGGNCDPHVVEVTVGRLRTRLRDHSLSIRAVPRRGYLLERVAGSPL